MHNFRVISDNRHSLVSKLFSGILRQSTEDNQASILKDTYKKSDKPSYIRHFNIRNELLESMEEQRLENYLITPEHKLTMYEDETTIAHISFRMYQV